VVTNPDSPKWLGRFGRRDTRAELAKVYPGAVFHEWKDATFAQYVTACDLAIIPLDLDDPFARGKPENKLLLFWRVGLPVVASASPAYVRAMGAAGLSLTCRTIDEWVPVLESLMADEARRTRAAEAGHSFVLRDHSEQRLLEKWDRVMTSVALTPTKDA
jgi:glycosyltransferase involved in cell wall biosynthesis